MDLNLTDVQTLFTENLLCTLTSQFEVNCAGCRVTSQTFPSAVKYNLVNTSFQLAFLPRKFADS